MLATRPPYYTLSRSPLYTKNHTYYYNAHALWMRNECNNVPWSITDIIIDHKIFYKKKRTEYFFIWSRLSETSKKNIPFEYFELTSANIKTGCEYQSRNFSGLAIEVTTDSRKIHADRRVSFRSKTKFRLWPESWFDADTWIRHLCDRSKY